MPFRFISLRLRPSRHSLLKVKKSQILYQFFHKLNAKKAEKVSSGTSLSASLTLESAWILPIFLFCMLVLICYLDMLRVQVRITSSLCESAKVMSMYMYGAEESDNITTAILTREMGCAYAKKHLEEDLSGERLTGLKNGISGISMGGSHIDGQKIKLQAKYKYQFPVSMIPMVEIPLMSSCTVYTWNGYDANDWAGIAAMDSGDMVYLTNWESVYHRDADCSHLTLSVSVTDIDSVESQRNSYGKKYTPCEKCVKQTTSSGFCYITKQGDCYHTSRTCSGLTRNIRYVLLEEDSGMRPCSRCG